MAAINVNQKNFREEILNSDKPVLVDFWAPWCGPCRMMAPVVEEIANERPDVKVAKINVDEEPELARQYGVMSIPVIMLLEGGRVTQKSVGAKPKRQILEML